MKMGAKAATGSVKGLFVTVLTSAGPDQSCVDVAVLACKNLPCHFNSTVELLVHFLRF